MALLKIAFKVFIKLHCGQKFLKACKKLMRVNDAFWKGGTGMRSKGECEGRYFSEASSIVIRIF